MDRRTGKIVSADIVAMMPKEMRAKFINMQIPPTERQLQLKKVGRNEPCPCGSGKKFKKCCLLKNKKGV